MASIHGTRAFYNCRLLWSVHCTRVGCAHQNYAGEPAGRTPWRHKQGYNVAVLICPAARNLRVQRQRGWVWTERSLLWSCGGVCCVMLDSNYGKRGSSADTRCINNNAGYDVDSDNRCGVENLPRRNQRFQSGVLSPRAKCGRLQSALQVWSLLLSRPAESGHYLERTELEKPNLCGLLHFLWRNSSETEFLVPADGDR